MKNPKRKCRSKMKYEESKQKMEEEKVLVQE